MRRHGYPSNEPRAIEAVLTTPTTGTAGPLSACLAWAEEHWEMVGMTVSIMCALTVSTILAVAFNVLFA